MTARLYLGGRYVGDVTGFSYSDGRGRRPSLVVSSPRRAYSASFTLSPAMTAMLVESLRVAAAREAFRRRAHRRLSHDPSEDRRL